jgi:hypothetical protein
VIEKSIFLQGELKDYGSKTSIPPNRTGEISEDKSAIIGKNGWCFIYEGSNNYKSAYDLNANDSMANEWSKILSSRQVFFDARKIKFLQIIIPNKASILPDLFPEKLGYDITVILNKIMNSKLDINMLSPIEKFRSEEIRELVFRKNDSHLTIVGNVLLMQWILDLLSIDITETIIKFEIETISSSHVGDLGCKFLPNISEICIVPDWKKGLLNQKSVNKTYEKLVNGLTGTQQSFFNPNAQIDKRVLIFGNSFFEKVPSWGLTPFFTSLFKHVKFVWDADINVGLVDTFLPDIVIAQTCERFLGRPALF